MFDVGFSELLVIAIVALLVIGPERLPKVARTAGHLFGRLQRYVNDVKADISREMELEELRKLRAEFEQTARSVEQSVSEVDQQVRSVGDDLTRSLSAPSEPPLPAPAAGANVDGTTAAAEGVAAPSSPAADAVASSPAKPVDEAKG